MNDLKMIVSNKLIINLFRVMFIANIRGECWINEKYMMIMMD